MILIQLFFAFFQVGLLSIGGGYASLASLSEVVVNQHGWLTTSDFTDLITLSQMTPGPLAINAATFVGTKVGGVIGAIVATVAFVLPSLMIVLILALVYYKYRSLKGMQSLMDSMRIVVIGLISAVGINLLQTLMSTDAILKIFMLIGSIILLRKTKINPIYVIVLSGVIYCVIKMFSML